MNSQSRTEQLLALCEEWEASARRKFADAEHETDAMGRRLIEHGAACYFNCAAELRNIIQPDTAADFDLQKLKQNAERP